MTIEYKVAAHIVKYACLYAYALHRHIRVVNKLSVYARGDMRSFYSSELRKYRRWLRRYFFI